MGEMYPGQGLTQAQVDARVASLAPGLAPVQSVAGRTGSVSLASGDVGLGNVPNVVAVDVAGAAAAAPVQSVNGRVGAPTVALRIPIVSSVATTWAAMPSALTELLGGILYRQAVGLAPYTQFRIIGTVTTVGFSGAALRVYYSTNAGGSWSVAAASGADMSLTSSGAIFGAWQNIVAGAKGDVLISVFGQGGNGIASPILGSLAVEVM